MKKSKITFAKKVILGILMSASLNGFCQVGFGTINPKATLDIAGKNTDATVADGIIAPRLTGNELAAKDAAYTTAQEGVIVYITAPVSVATDKTINITSTGYYFFNGAFWKNIADMLSSTSAYTPICSTVLVSGTYYTGIPLSPSSNFITLKVDVTKTGTYSVNTTASGMIFSASGEFTSLGQQEIVLQGQGYPLVVGLNFVGLTINNTICSALINVLNGLATVSTCGTIGTLTGEAFANVPIAENTLYQSYTAGPAYSGGGVYGITSTPTNGMQIYKPLNGTFNATGTSVEYGISGTPLAPGTTTINYSVNSQACSFTIPVQSGTGRASAVNCSGTSAGSYNAELAIGPGRTKQVTLTVATPGTFYIRTNTVNGYYFAGSTTASATGALVVTLTAAGTPLLAGEDTFTVTVSNAATTFITCTFLNTVGIPLVIPDFTTLSCSTLSNTVTYIKANNTGGADCFGAYLDDSSFNYGKSSKISADGLTLAVGAIGEDGSTTGGPINASDNNILDRSGATYIYTRASLSGAWTFQAKLKPVQLGNVDFFGNSLDLSNDGNTLIVGSLYEDGSGTGVDPSLNDGATDAGAAYVFSRTGNTWSQQAYLKANNSGAADFFGVNVTISGDGNTVAVGALGDDGNTGGINTVDNNLLSNTGAVYTYTRNGSTWSFENKIKASTTHIGTEDWFGSDVALNNDGTRLAVGAQYENGSNIGVNPFVNDLADNAGAVYIFSKPSGTWSQEAYIKASNVNSNDLFGRSIDLDGSGNKLIVGAYGEDSNTSGVNTTANESATDSGAAFVFERTNGTWSQKAYLKANNTGSIDNFGRTVALSNDGIHAIVGAMFEDGGVGCINGVNNDSNGDSGAAYSYTLVSGNWTFAFKYKIPVTVDTSDFFGGCVSANSNGTCFAISAGSEDGSSTTINGTHNNSAAESGAVFVFTKN
jgi:hypothetical protein